MTILAARVILDVFLFIAFFIMLGVDAGFDECLNVLMREFFLGRRFHNMTFNKTVDFLGGFMRDFRDVRVTALAFDLRMDTVVKYGFVYIEESEFSFFVNPADARILMAQQAVAYV